MLAKTTAAAVIGIDAYPVEIEVSQSAASRTPMAESTVTIVGLPDLAVRESRERIYSAMVSSAFQPLKGSTVVNLAPADLKKEGSSFDLGIALAMLATAGLLNPEALAQCAAIGELALDGKLRPVKGALPIAARLSREPSIKALLVPEANASEAAVAAGNTLAVYSASTLKEAVEIINSGDRLPYKATLADAAQPKNGREPDFNEVKGQALARRAVEIAAAGSHNILMSGPPGTGKSMIAMRLAGIMPPMTLAESLETSRIHSVLGLLDPEHPLLADRPFRSPHHTISDVGLIGGGKDPHPGEISLAHNGVLFLDELPEFKRNVLEVLRQPLENGHITISRAAGSCTFPARFLLCAAMNPCPCGRGEFELGCTCSVEEKRRYQKKISGPLLDRIDLQTSVRQLSEAELIAAPTGESTASIRARVVAARQLQLARFQGLGIYCNAQMGSREIARFCQTDREGVQILREAIARFKLSPRAYDRILKVARTIADLAGAEKITSAHLFEAVNYRKMEY